MKTHELRALMVLTRNPLLNKHFKHTTIHFLAVVTNFESTQLFTKT